MITELFTLVSNGEASAVEKFLRDNPLIVNSYNDHGHTPLMIAALRGDESTCRCLLNASANPDLRSKSADERNGSAFMMAVWSQNVELVRLFLQFGADANTFDDVGETPLIIASSFGKPELVEILLRAGADVNAQDKLGRTALIWAARDNRDDVVIKLLLEHSANINIQDARGWSALKYAEEMEKPKQLVMTLRERVTQHWGQNTI